MERTSLFSPLTWGNVVLACRVKINTIKHVSLLLPSNYTARQKLTSLHIGMEAGYSVSRMQVKKSKFNILQGITSFVLKNISNGFHRIPPKMVSSIAPPLKDYHYKICLIACKS